MGIRKAVILASCGALLLAAVPGARGAEPAGPRPRTPARAPTIFDITAHMDVNNLDMFLTNYGPIAWDLSTGYAGLIYPKGTTKTVVYAAGLWVAGTVNGQIRSTVSEYSSEYVPGPMAGGTFQADQPEFRSYRIDRGGTGYADYLSDAVPQGAPVDGLGNPFLLGDATVWSVFNDADPTAHSNEAGSTAPLGLEVRQSIFAFNQPGSLGNTIFVKWKILNRGAQMLENAYASAWCDPDLGNYTDDLVGYDRDLELGYCYNATNNDTQYGSSPPAVGFSLLRGPIVSPSPGVYDTLGATSFTMYTDGTSPRSASQTYNYLRGLHADGSPIHEYNSTLWPITTFMVDGDPVTSTGWLDTGPSDRRFNLAAGPFTMAPGDSQEIVVAVLVGRGTDRLSSITALRAVTAAARAASLEPPVTLAVGAPPATSTAEGQALAFAVKSTDPDGIASLTSSGTPVGATFQDHGDGTGTFAWTPGFDQAGVYTVAFTAHGTSGGTATATTVISVQNVNRAPVADPGGPYSSYLDVPVAFDGTGSQDPDGDALTYAWAFGDETTGTGPTPSHLYPYKGLFGVALVVSDGHLTHTATTTAEIVDRLAARAFTTAGNQSIRIGSGKPQWCVEIEPVGHSFDISAVDAPTIALISPGTGAVDRIYARSGKALVSSDRDGNGVAELTVCFARDDLRVLFSDIQGQASVPVTLEGDLTTGGQFRAALNVLVIATGGPLAAALQPNPLRSVGTLRFVTRTPGRVTVTLFDPSGRLVRRVWSATAPAGLHRVPLDGRDDAGRDLASGVYFYRIDSPEGSVSGHIMVLK